MNLLTTEMRNCCIRYTQHFQPTVIVWYFVSVIYAGGVCDCVILCIFLRKLRLIENTTTKLAIVTYLVNLSDQFWLFDFLLNSRCYLIGDYMIIVSLNAPHFSV